jgi:hypothetical protein
MRSRREREIRRMAAVTQFGVGAIWDHDGESLVQMDVSRWKSFGHDIELGRLARALGVSGFRAPATVGDDDQLGIPFFRFPEWLFCPQCRAMSRYNKRNAGLPPSCSTCRSTPRLVPIRFVGICEDGHLFDIDWVWWAHRRSETPGMNCRSSNISWQNLAGGIGLESISVRCLDCKASCDLGDVVRTRHRCTGRQPWQPPDSARKCDARTIGVQRGSSNVWFGAITSALDIPPDSDFKEGDASSTEIQNDSDFIALVQQSLGSYFESAQIDKLARRHDVGQDAIHTLLTRARRLDSGDSSPNEPSVDNLRVGEWQALTGPATNDARSRFVVEPMDLSTHLKGLDATNDEIARIAYLIDRLVAAKKIHEVRALRGFTRMTPENDHEFIVSSSLDANVKWLPAYEVFGEGIFFTLDESAMRKWESRPTVIEAVSNLASNSRGFPRDIGDVSRTLPRLYLLHTIAHLLIRQLAFDCGYPAASLRERLYVTDAERRTEMAGVLIYTADGDAEGSMGGLVRQARPEEFVYTLSRALASAQWCSLDPICSETRSGPTNINIAACHSCCLTAETSCELSNQFLFRSLLVDDQYGLAFAEDNYVS